MECAVTIDEMAPGGLTAQIVVLQGDLERGLHGLTTPRSEVNVTIHYRAHLAQDLRQLDGGFGGVAKDIQERQARHLITRRVRQSSSSVAHHHRLERPDTIKIFAPMGVGQPTPLTFRENDWLPMKGVYGI